MKRYWRRSSRWRKAWKLVNERNDKRNGWRLWAIAERIDWTKSTAQKFANKEAYFFSLMLRNLWSSAGPMSEFTKAVPLPKTGGTIRFFRG